MFVIVEIVQEEDPKSETDFLECPNTTHDTSALVLAAYTHARWTQQVQQHAVQRSCRHTHTHTNVSRMQLDERQTGVGSAGRSL